MEAPPSNPPRDDFGMHQPVISFTIPAPSEEGGPEDQFNVQLPDGRVFVVNRPEGCRVGDLVHALIVDCDDGSTSLVLVPSGFDGTDTSFPTNDNVRLDAHPIDEQEEESTSFKPAISKRGIAAMAAGGVIGILIAGPVFGVVVAGAILVGATVPNSAAYKHAAEDFRNTPLGRKMAHLKESAAAQAKEIDKRFRVSENVHSTTTAVTSKAKDLDTKYDLSTKAQKATSAVGAAVNTCSETVARQAESIDQKYHVREKLSATGSAISQDLNAAGAAFSQQAREVDDKYKVSEKLQSGMQAVSTVFTTAASSLLQNVNRGTSRRDVGGSEEGMLYDDVGGEDGDGLDTEEHATPSKTV